MRKRFVNGFLMAFFVLIMGPSVIAIDANHLISNSENWEDVYSVLLLGSLTASEADFLTSTSHGPLLLNSVPLSKRVGIITSKDVPFVFNYKPIVDAKGYNNVEELEVSNANLELVDELEDVTNFIIVDDSYGYNPIAVTPYAVLTNSWVFLASDQNIIEIESILDDRQVDSVLLYGYLDRGVVEVMDKFDPEVINTGDRFKDNIVIVEKYKEIKDTKQVILSNGEFIEREIMKGTHPVLFTGKENVPDQIGEYLKESDISIGVLVGNELVNAATNIRRTTGISVMVKFAQGARAPATGAAVSQVEGLDLYYLPSPSLNLGIYDIKYNGASSQIEVTYHSTSNVPLYFKGSITARSDSESETVGDLDPIFLAPNDYKTVIYPDISLTGEDLRAEIFTLFGEVPTALDRQLEGEFELNRINILDNCEIEVDSVVYNKQSKGFVVNVKNTGTSDCYVDIEFEDIRINNVLQVIGTEGSIQINAGKRGKILINHIMDEEDLQDNPFISLVAYYGEREEILVKTFRGKYELEIQKFTNTTYAIIIVIILIAILLFILWKRKKDNEW